MSDNEKKVVSLAGAREREKEKQIDKTSDNQPNVHCSFCGRPNVQVLKMIKGPGVNICSECVMICIQFLILEDKVSSPEVQKVLDQFWQGFRK